MNVAITKLTPIYRGKLNGSGSYLNWKNTVTQKTESMFCLDPFHAPYFETEWAESK
jgi:hypothetical protein